MQSMVTLDYCQPVKAAVIILDSHNYAIKYPPTYRCKPLTFGATLATSIPPLQAFAVSSSNGDSGGDDTDGIEVEIEKLSSTRRRIRSKVTVEASLQTLWGILTDYERLADFIPGLAVSQVLDKRQNFARLLQIGQQNLAFGLKFNAKGIVDCYEKEVQRLPYGLMRDIEFEMIEGDFQLFQGKWSIQQSVERTTLSYTVDVEPKMWLPVQLVEGRLCREIKMNLFSIREVAQKASPYNSST